MSSGLPFTGLSADEVTLSREEHGSNVLPPSARDPWCKLYLEKFNDPVIRILIIAAVIATLAGAYHGDYIEGIGILLGVDTIPDMFRTTTNVTGHLTAAVIVARDDAPSPA